MPNNLFNSTQGNNIMSEFQAFQQNPAQYLIDHNINIPKEYMDNPQGAVQYLMNSGKLTQNQLNQIMQKARMFGFKF